MEQVQQILSSNQDVNSLIGLGLADVKLRVNNKFWLNSLQNRFGGFSFLKTYTQDPNINWFYMYQKFAQQELIIYGDNGYNQISRVNDAKFTSFILPYPTIQVFVHYHLTYISILTLSGKIYTIRSGKDDIKHFNELKYWPKSSKQTREENAAYDEAMKNEKDEKIKLMISEKHQLDSDDDVVPLPFKVQKVVATKELLYMLTEDHDLYVLEYHDAELYDLHKFQFQFEDHEMGDMIVSEEQNKVFDIVGGGSDTYCVVLSKIFNKFATIRGVYIDETKEMQYNIEYHSNVAPIKQIVTADLGFLILDIFGRIYNLGDNDHGQLGHSGGNGISCLNYKSKFKKIYSISDLCLLQDEKDNIYLHGLYPMKLREQPYSVRNIVGNNKFYIMYSKFDDFLFTERVDNTDDYNPRHGNNPQLINYDNSISIVFPTGAFLKKESKTRDFTYDIFASFFTNNATEDINTMILTYGVIEEDAYFLQMHPEILEEKEDSTPNYIIKVIDGKTYLYTRPDNDNNGDLFRIQVNYDASTGKVIL
jgi:hypothetical protein